MRGRPEGKAAAPGATREAVLDSTADLSDVVAIGAGQHVWLESARTGRTVSRPRLREVCDAWAREAGTPSGVRLGLVAPEPTDFAVLYVALVAAGLTVVPLDPSAAPGPNGELLRRAGATATVVRSDTPVDVPGVRLEVGPELVPGPGARLPALGGQAAGAERGGRAVGGVLLHSSGSTGPRKAVLLEEHRLLHVARAVAGHHRLGPEDRGYNPLPLFHVNAEVVAVLGSLVSGGTLVLDDRFHRTGFFDLLERCGVTWVNAVPAILSILAAEPGEPALPAGVRFVRSASAPLPLPVLRRFEERFGVPVVETYGMTEAASQITANPLDARRAGSVGVPVGVDLRVVGGRVQIRGPGVIRAYADGAGAERFDAEGWLDTGDLGRLDADGYLYLEGRDGDVINRGGEKVFPREVEEVLLRHPGVRDAVVVPQDDPVLGQVPVAFVVAHGTRSGASDGDLAAEVARLAEQELPRSRRPVRVEVLEALPTGATGKVSRSAATALARRAAAG